MDAVKETTDAISTIKSEWRKGWVIVMSAFYLSFVTDGFVYCFGLLLVEFIDYFEEGRATVVTIVAIQTTTMFLADKDEHFSISILNAQLTGTLGPKYGYRIMTVIGTILSSIGFVVSSFATNVYHLWISYGPLGGIGFGFMYMSAIVCVLGYFKKHKTLATGITVSGSGAGAFVLNLSIRQLIDYYGWRGAVLLQAGIVLHGVVVGLLLTEPIKKATGQTQENNSFVSSVKSFMSSVFRKELLTDVCCVLYLLSSLAAYIATFIPFTFIPDQVIEAGMTKTEAAILVSSIGLSNTAGRVIFGWIGDRTCFSRTYLLAGVMLLNGVLTGLSPLMSTFETKLTYTILFGVFAGAFHSFVFVVLTDIVRPDLTASALGLMFFIFAIGSAIATPFAGFLFDQTGYYTIPFIVSGAEYVLESVLLVLCKLVSSKAGGYQVNTKISLNNS